MRATETVTAQKIVATGKNLVIVLKDRKIRIPWAKCSPILARATPQQRIGAELSPGGYGIHWPLLDEDLSVGGLLRDHG